VTTMFYSLPSRSWRNIRADLSANLATLLAVGLAASIPLVFALLALNLGATVDSFIGGVEVVAYLAADVSEEQMTETAAQLRQLPAVREVEEVSSAKALARFTAELPEVAEVVRELGENPLPPSLEIKLDADFRDLAALAAFSDQVARLPGVVEVDDGRQWVRPMANFTRYIWLAALLLGLFLAAAAALLVANTIRLAIYRRREEIAIYRLVGATNGFIRGPLYIEGVLQGMIGSLLGLSACYGLYRLAAYRLTGRDEVMRWLLGGTDPLWFHPAVAAVVLLSGGAIGLLAAIFSTRRFLRI